jgi:hypothetical protein
MKYLNAFALPINLTESLLLNDFLFRFNARINQKEITAIYRGEDCKIICIKLGVDLKHGGLQQLSQRIFLYGDKSKYYFSKNYFEKEGGTFTIDSIDKDMVNQLFKLIQKSIKNKHAVHEAFYNKNNQLKEYFLNQDNKSDFYNKLQSIQKAKALAVRNYYLKLVHQFGPKGYKTKSHHVSTTRNKHIANEFATDIIIHGWDATRKINSIILKKLDLPIANGTPYPQEEISIIGGLLPHYIIGVEFIKKKIFLLNPFIFRAKITDQLFINGLPIDQSKFFVELNKTGHSHGFVSHKDKIMDLV